MTEAVIWRKMAAISAWISGSVFSIAAAAAAAAGAVVEFSFVGFDFDFFTGAKIWTWVVS